MSDVLGSMPTWAWLAFGLALWLLVGLLVGFLVGGAVRLGETAAERERDLWADHLRDADWDWPVYRDKESA